MDGHSGDIYFVAYHPTNPTVFATVSDSGHVHLWDGSIRQMTHCAVRHSRHLWDERRMGSLLLEYYPPLIVTSLVGILPPSDCNSLSFPVLAL